MRTIKKVNHVIKVGKILTFKEPYNGKYQILIEKVKKKGETYQLLDRFGFTMPFMTKQEIVDLIDWEWMEEVHGINYI